MGQKTELMEILKLLSESMNNLYQRVSKSIVEIQTMREGFFANFEGGGSGVILSPNGYILTNWHVVAVDDKIKKDTEYYVKLSDERRYGAELIGWDSVTDIAVLKIPAKNLKPAHIGDSDSCKIGDIVFAMGSPLGLSGTISFGILSNKNDMTIQTDASINPGNSGGALVNHNGEVIGINFMGIDETAEGRKVENLNFAIPIKTAKMVYERLKNKGGELIWANKVIGIEEYEEEFINPEIITRHKLKSDRGIKITELEIDSLAEEKFKEEDIIVAINGEPMDSAVKFHWFFFNYQGDKSLTVNAIRGGALIRVKISIISMGANIPGIDICKACRQAVRIEDVVTGSDGLLYHKQCYKGAKHRDDDE